jgi:hypothetical protein
VITNLWREFGNCPWLYKVKHDIVTIDSRITSMLGILCYVLIYMCLYFVHQFTDVAQENIFSVGLVSILLMTSDIHHDENSKAWACC